MQTEAEHVRNTLNRISTMITLSWKFTRKLNLHQYISDEEIKNDGLSKTAPVPLNLKTIFSISRRIFLKKMLLHPPQKRAYRTLILYQKRKKINIYICQNPPTYRSIAKHFMDYTLSMYTHRYEAMDTDNLWIPCHIANKSSNRKHRYFFFSFELNTLIKSGWWNLQQSIHGCHENINIHYEVFQ